MINFLTKAAFFLLGCAMIVLAARFGVRGMKQRLSLVSKHRKAHRRAKTQGEPPMPFHVPSSMPWYTGPSTADTDGLFKSLKRKRRRKS